VFRKHLGAFALAVLCVLPLAASAQTVPAPGVGAPPAAQQQSHHRHHHRSPYLRAMRGLNLSDAQKQQIAGILKNSRTASKATDPQTRRANMQAVRRQIEGVLTPDQRTQLQTKLAQAHKHFAQPNGQAPQARPQ
jgi:Spy/CpxP family protein refolding chaperone